MGKVQIPVIVTCIRYIQIGLNVLKPKIIQFFFRRSSGILKNSGSPKGGNSYLHIICGDGAFVLDVLLC